jgi:hypothetical protein
MASAETNISLVLAAAKVYKGPTAARRAYQDVAAIITAKNLLK